MKYILKTNYILAILLSVLIIGCEVDDDSPIVITDDITAVSLNQTGTAVVTQATSGSIDIILSKALSNAVLVNYTLNGVSEQTQFNAGETTLNIPYNLTSAGDVFSVSLNSVTALYDSSVTLAGNTDFTIAFADVNNVIFNVLEPSTTALALSLGEFDSAGDWQQDPLGFGFGSTFTIPYATGLANSADIAPNFYAFDIFPLVSLSSTAFRVQVINVDGIEEFTGNLGSVNANTDNPTVLVNVTDDPNNAGSKIYSFSTQ